MIIDFKEFLNTNLSTKELIKNFFEDEYNKKDKEMLTILEEIRIFILQHKQQIIEENFTSQEFEYILSHKETEIATKFEIIARRELRELERVISKNEIEEEKKERIEILNNKLQTILNKIKQSYNIYHEKQNLNLETILKYIKTKNVPKQYKEFLQAYFECVIKFNATIKSAKELIRHKIKNSYPNHNELRAQTMLYIEKVIDEINLFFREKGLI